jgi:hypothetical protein
MSRCSSGSDVLAECFHCGGKSLPQRSCLENPGDCPDDAYNVFWFLRSRDISPLRKSRPVSGEILMHECIVTCTWYCLKTFIHNSWHTRILSCTPCCPNGNLHVWFLSLKNTTCIHTHLEPMDATMSLKAKSVDKIMIACTDVFRQLHLSESCTIAPTFAHIDERCLTRIAE